MMVAGRISWAMYSPNPSPRIKRREQHVPGETVTIEYQNQSGEWVTERAQSTDRPDADVID
jgi:hypothetical protein